MSRQLAATGPHVACGCANLTFSFTLHTVPCRVYKGYLQPEPAAATPQPADAQQPAGDGSEAGSSATAHAIGQALISKSGAAQPLPVAIKVT